MSHAAEEKLKDPLKKLHFAAEHRLESRKKNSIHEVSRDVKVQLKFLAELDRLEKEKT